VIVAAHAGMDILGITCVTNMAAGILDQPLVHAEVMETAARVRDDFIALVRKILTMWE
ncbi:MAG: purine-nucleoside phosphorylase, partial [Spirochaetales bacterium]|nr:purine-nucleoside phosphorylase [Spirochaetales bacterium]